MRFIIPFNHTVNLKVQGKNCSKKCWKITPKKWQSQNKSIDNHSHAQNVILRIAPIFVCKTAKIKGSAILIIFKIITFRMVGDSCRRLSPKMLLFQLFVGIFFPVNALNKQEICHRLCLNTSWAYDTLDSHIGSDRVLLCKQSRGNAHNFLHDCVTTTTTTMHKVN